MSVQIYLGEEYEHPQENQAFRKLCSAGSKYFSRDATIIGNIPFHDDRRRAGQIDALVLRQTSITIVDFKDVGGVVRVSENGEWNTSEGVRIAGGSRDANPFQQVRRYKQALAGWLGTSGLLPSPNDLSHISGLVMFTRPMSVDASALNEKTKKWFCAADEVGAMDFLRDRASRHLDLSADCMAKIVAEMQVKPHLLPPTELMVPRSAVQRAQQAGYFEAMQDIEDERQAEWWAKNGDRVQADYDEACRGWAIHDSLAEIRRRMERLQHDGAFVDEVVAALDRALWRKSVPLSAALRRYQPLTSVDLTLSLRKWGIEPDDHV
jgi:hypothetical protein